MRKYRCLLGKSTANHNIWYFLRTSSISVQNRTLIHEIRPISLWKAQNRLDRRGFASSKMPQFQCNRAVHRTASLERSLCPSRTPNKTQNPVQNGYRLWELWRIRPERQDGKTRCEARWAGIAFVQKRRKASARGLCHPFVHRKRRPFSGGVFSRLVKQESVASLRLNPHAVERFVHEEYRHQEECHCQPVCEHRIARAECHGKLDGK